MKFSSTTSVRRAEIVNLAFTVTILYVLGLLLPVYNSTNTDMNEITFDELPEPKGKCYTFLYYLSPLRNCLRWRIYVCMD